jgi:hypothetical protein
LPPVPPVPELGGVPLPVPELGGVPLPVPPAPVPSLLGGATVLGELGLTTPPPLLEELESLGAAGLVPEEVIGCPHSLNP